VWQLRQQPQQLQWQTQQQEVQTSFCVRKGKDDQSMSFRSCE
jgi:hypothetical protein